MVGRLFPGAFIERKVSRIANGNINKVRMFHIYDKVVLFRDNR